MVPRKCCIGMVISFFDISSPLGLGSVRMVVILQNVWPMVTPLSLKVSFVKIERFMTAFQYGYEPIYKLTKLISDSFESKNINFDM